MSYDIDSESLTPKEYGAKAELFVLEKLEQYFEGREFLSLSNYPVYRNKSSSMGEMDILLIERTIGVTVIEVKALDISQVDKLEGNEFYVNNYFGKNKINPYQQAKRQLNMLTKILDKDPILQKEYGLRIVLALPYISKADWNDKGFNRVSENKPILFKDDFENIHMLRKIEQMNIREKKKSLTSQQWIRLRSYFDSSIKLGELGNQSYSRLYIFPEIQSYIDKIVEIEQLLRKGIKITVLSYFKIKTDSLANNINAFLQLHQLEYYESFRSPSFEETIIIEDGEFESEEELKRITLMLENDFPKFNIEQYKVVHANVYENLMVSAGAGTGKTHVMMDRIMYLLTKNIEIKDIIMITFTNEATNEMKRRLQKKLISLSRLTGLNKYNELAESLKSMKISTIHTYFKETLQKLAHEFGYGLNFRIRSYKQMKKDIIGELIDEFYVGNPNAREILIIQDYVLIDTIYDMWEEFGRRGLSGREVTDFLDWGEVEEKKNKVFSDLFQYVFSSCEKRFNNIKQEENAVEINDLIRDMKTISLEENKINQLDLDKHIFIDEFQDSDNAQIDFVASLAEFLNYKLFIVGDVKQSIYRFRGADNRAFDLMKEQVEFPYDAYSLNKNYRTKEAILDTLHTDVFTGWEKKGLLLYDKPLTGIYSGDSSSYNPIQMLRVKSNRNVVKATIEAIRYSQRIISKLAFNGDGKNKQIAIIVRTNKEASEVANWCKNEGIAVKQNVEGTFFKSRAVYDFKVLLDGLLYSNKARYLVNALQTPYFRYEIPAPLLIQFNGDNEKIISYINSRIGKDFVRFQTMLKTLPVMAVIQKIITEKDFFYHLEKYFQNEVEEAQLSLFVKQYKKNLYHLLNMLHQQFDVMNSTLYDINEWLQLHMQTNRTESEPKIDISEEVVEVTTVHRAKGLEYHTVIMPKTTYSFIFKKNKFYLDDNIDDNNMRKVGWHLNYDDLDIKNNYYDNLNDYNIKEVYKEETRLLYVALTRAIERLVIVLPSNKLEGTWSEILYDTNLEVKDYDS